MAGKNLGWSGFLEEYRWPLLMAVIGLAVLVFGLSQQYTSQPVVEIIPVDENEDSVWIDLSGAVVKPGVYELTAGSRVNDLMIKAGGLSAKADREWVAKNINLAQKLVDGVKIYIPTKEETEGAVLGEEQEADIPLTEKININTATVNQLDTLWGIGESRAKTIIESRPHQSVEELLDKKIIPANVYEQIKDKISVF